MTREMKDSGVEWIGKIPKEWEVTKLKNYANISSGEYISNEQYLKNGKYKIIGSNGAIGVTDRFNNISRAIVTGRVGTIGNVYHVGKSWITDNVLIIKKKINIHQNYLYYVIGNLNFELFSSGTAQPLITATDLKNQHVPVNNLSEQKKIANFLDEKTKEIDTIISKTKEVIEDYKAYKQSLITETVTKGLNQDVEMKDTGIEWIGEIPSHWDITKIKNLYYIQAGGDLDEKNFSTLSTDLYKYPIYTNKQNKRDIYGYTSKANYPGDSLTVTARGDIGIAFYRDHSYDAIIRLLVLIPKKNNFAPYHKYFINGVLNFNEGSSAVKQLSKDQLSPYKVCVPSLEEQKEIANYLDKKTGDINEIISTKERLLKEMESYKKSLIYETVTGKREVD